MADRFYEVAFKYDVNGQECNSTLAVFGHDLVGEVTPLHAQDIAELFGNRGALWGAWCAALQTDSKMLGVRVVELLAPTDRSVPESGWHAIPSLGTAGPVVQPIPDPICSVLTKVTDAAVRGATGHLFSPPIRDNQYIANEAIGSIWSDKLTAIVAELNHFNLGGNAWTEGEWGTGVYSRTRRAKGDAEFAFHIKGYLIRPAVTWLRSRSVVTA